MLTNFQSFFYYQLSSKVCVNVNECSSSSLNDCDNNAACTDTEGSYTCACLDGFEGDGLTCTNINECADPALNNCDNNADCQDLAPGFSCTCKAGFRYVWSNNFFELIVILLIHKPLSVLVCFTLKLLLYRI